MSPQRHQRIEGRQGRTSACNGHVQPLALGFDAQVSPGFLKGDPHLPAQEDAADYRAGLKS